MVVDYLSSQPNRAGYQVSTKQGSGPKSLVATACVVAYAPSKDFLPAGDRIVKDSPITQDFPRERRVK